MIDYSSNINAVGSMEVALVAARKHVDIILKYPDYLNTNIIALVSNYFGVPPETVAVGAGSTQVFFDLPRLLPYMRAVVVVPAFWEYTALNERNHKEIQKVYLKAEQGFEPDYDLLGRTVREGDAVFLCNVNNPTSRLYKKEALLKLVKDNPETHFIVDETYLLFRGDYEEQTVSKEVQMVRNLHVVTSLSKFFALPGIRLGILISNKETVASYITSVHVPYSIHPLSCVAFQPLFEDAAFTRQCREFYDEERKDFYAKAKKKLSGRLEMIEPDGNFILGRILTGQKSATVVHALSEKGILIRDGGELSDLGEAWIRFSLRSEKDNAFLLKKLDEVLTRKS